MDQRIYSSAQREAMASMYTRGTTAGRVVELAGAGALEHSSGAMLGPFDTTENTVRSVARRARGREAAAASAMSALDLPARDAIERLRRQLVTAIDTELTRIEIEQGEGRFVGGEALRQVARAARELAAIPGPNDPHPLAPGAKINGMRNGGETRGGLAGKILAAHRTDRTAPHGG